jgi:hypothetical protein
MIAKVVENESNAGVNLPKIENQPLTIDLANTVAQNEEQKLSIFAVKMRSPNGIASPTSPRRMIVSPPTPATPPSPDMRSGVLSPAADYGAGSDISDDEQQQHVEEKENEQNDDEEVIASESHSTQADEEHSTQADEEGMPSEAVGSPHSAVSGESLDEIELE